MMGMPTPQQHSEQPIDQRLEAAKETLVTNGDSVSNTLLEKASKGEKYTARAQALMLRVMQFGPDGTRMEDIDARTTPLNVEFGNALTELMKHIPQTDSSTAQMVGVALTIQAIVMCIGKQNWDKVRSLAATFKERLANTL